MDDALRAFISFMMIFSFVNLAQAFEEESYTFEQYEQKLQLDQKMFELKMAQEELFLRGKNRVLSTSLLFRV